MLHTIENEFLRITASEQGAELQSIRDREGLEYLWQGDPAYWEKRAINIFPYVARLTEGRYIMDGQSYNMRIHGFACYTPFVLKESSATHMVFELTDNEALYPQYPRHFSFRVIYRLLENTLEYTFEVENRDSKTMHFGLGGHPGFNIPFAGGSFEDYRIRFSRPCTPQRVKFSDNVFVEGYTDYPLEDGQTIPLRHDIFNQDAIILKGTPHALTLESDITRHSITVTYPGMDYVGFWHATQTDAPYVCVEPWCSLPAREGTITVMEEQEDLIHLAPGKTYENRWTITIQ